MPYLWVLLESQLNWVDYHSRQEDLQWKLWNLKYESMSHIIWKWLKMPTRMWLSKCLMTGWMHSRCALGSFLLEGDNCFYLASRTRNTLVTILSSWIAQEGALKSCPKKLRCSAKMMYSFVSILIHYLVLRIRESSARFKEAKTLPGHGLDVVIFFVDN
jgi:hypothetical protein